ncbi:MAG TPA: undecaprenyl-diphosphate phosphatase [Candidatus Woesebacteria bacterium]|nr:undecaprenyl-diphosphate phosphatase [Candidatus Woesebacteria bacterium]
MITALILGIIEGITEFLPISSTGHLIIANRFINFKGEFANLFDIIVQLGAVLAVIVYYRSKIIPPVQHRKKLSEYINNWFKILIAFIPAAIIGFLLSDIIEKYLFSTLVVGIAMVLGGILLLVADRQKFKSSANKLNEVGIQQALIIGLFQCLSLIPGMSRSASTIIGGLFKDLSRETAIEFSFLLSIPTLFGASVLKLVKYQQTLGSTEVTTLAVGLVTSFVTALLVISLLTKYIKTHNFQFFAYYRIVIGLIILSLSLFRIL